MCIRDDSYFGVSLSLSGGFFVLRRGGAGREHTGVVYLGLPFSCRDYHGAVNNRRTRKTACVSFVFFRRELMVSGRKERNSSAVYQFFFLTPVGSVFGAGEKVSALLAPRLLSRLRELRARNFPGKTSRLCSVAALFCLSGARVSWDKDGIFCRIGKGAPVSFPPLFFSFLEISAKILPGRFDTGRKFYGLRRAAGVCAGGILFSAVSCGRVCRTTLNIISNLILYLKSYVSCFVCVLCVWREEKCSRPHVCTGT